MLVLPHRLLLCILFFNQNSDFQKFPAIEEQTFESCRIPARRNPENLSPSSSHRPTMILEHTQSLTSHIKVYITR